MQNSNMAAKAAHPCGGWWKAAMKCLCAWSFARMAEGGQTYRLQASRQISKTQKMEAEAAAREPRDAHHLGGDRTKQYQLSCQSSGSESRYEMLVRLELADTAEAEPGYRMELRIPISKTQKVESRGSIIEGTEGTPITWEVTDSITAVVWQQARMTKGWQDAKA